MSDTVSYVLHVITLNPYNVSMKCYYYNLSLYEEIEAKIKCYKIIQIIRKI